MDSFFPPLLPFSLDSFVLKLLIDSLFLIVSAFVCEFLMVQAPPFLLFCYFLVTPQEQEFLRLLLAKQVRRQVRRGCSALTAAAPAAAAGGGGICGVLNWRQQGQRDEEGAVCRQGDCLLNAIGVRHQVSAVGGQPCRERACQLGPGRASAQRGMERDARIHA